MSLCCFWLQLGVLLGFGCLFLLLIQLQEHFLSVFDFFLESCNLSAHHLILFLYLVVAQSDELSI